MLVSQHCLLEDDRSGGIPTDLLNNLTVSIASCGLTPVMRACRIIIAIGFGKIHIIFLTCCNIESRVKLGLKNRSRLTIDSLPVVHFKLYYLVVVFHCSWHPKYSESSQRLHNIESCLWWKLQDLCRLSIHKSFCITHPTLDSISFASFEQVSFEV